MQKIEMLYHAIKKLSQIEKRNFRLEITKYKETSNYVKVYDFLGKSPDFPCQIKIKQFVEAEKIKHLTMHVGYIFDKLIDFLLNNRTPVYETEIQKQLTQKVARTKMLRSLGFFKAAEKETFILLKKADEHGCYQFSINALLDLHIYQNFNIKSNLCKLPLVNGQNLSLVERVQFYQQQLQLHEMLRVLNIQYSRATTLLRNDPTINIQTLNLGTIPDIDDMVVNQKAQVLFHQIKIFSFIIHSQYDKLVDYLIRLKQEMEKEYFTSQDQIIFYSFVMHAYGSYVLFDKSDPSFIHFAKNYQSIIESKGKYIDNISPNISHSLKVVSKTLIIQSLYLKKNLQAKDIKKLEAENSHLYIGSKVTYFKSLLNLAFLYLIAKDYKSSNKYIVEINNATAVEVKIIAWEVPFVELIESFENGTVKYTKYQINKLKRKAKTQKTIPPIQSLILKLIQQLLDNPHEQSLSIMKATLALLIELEDRFLLGFLKYSFWLKNRIAVLERNPAYVN